MPNTRQVGIGLTALAALGYAVGVAAPYPGRAASIVGVMVNVVSQSTNEVMKRLTVVATIFIPLRFVVGVYGMNFSDHAANLPELSWPHAYPAVMVGMVFVTGILFVHFRQEGWIRARTRRKGYIHQKSARIGTQSLKRPFATVLPGLNPVLYDKFKYVSHLQLVRSLPVGTSPYSLSSAGGEPGLL